MDNRGQFPRAIILPEGIDGRERWGEPWEPRDGRSRPVPTPATPPGRLPTYSRNSRVSIFTGSAPLARSLKMPSGQDSMDSPPTGAMNSLGKKSTRPGQCPGNN